MISPKKPAETPVFIGFLPFITNPTAKSRFNGNVRTGQTALAPQNEINAPGDDFLSIGVIGGNGGVKCFFGGVALALWDVCRQGPEPATGISR
jgi:hypothetical protein